MRRADRALRGIDARDAGDEKIGPGEVERVGMDERRNRARRIGVAHRGRDETKPLVVAGDFWERLRQSGNGELLVELFVLQPVVRLVLEHRDNEDLRRERLGDSGRGGDQQSGGEGERLQRELPVHENDAANIARRTADVKAGRRA